MSRARSGPGQDRRLGTLLALGLVGSGLLIATTAGWAAIVLGAGQVTAGVLVALRPGRIAVVATSALLLALAPLSALRHWTVHLPLTCACQRMAKPAPGLVSGAGLAVLVDIGLIMLAAWFVRPSVGAMPSAAADPAVTGRPGPGSRPWSDR